MGIYKKIKKITSNGITKHINTKHYFMDDCAKPQICVLKLSTSNVNVFRNRIKNELVLNEVIGPPLDVNDVIMVAH